MNAYSDGVIRHQPAAWHGDAAQWNGYGALGGSTAPPLPTHLGSIFERKSMGEKYRTAVTTTVLTYIDTAKQIGDDPLKMSHLSTVGIAMLGAEVSARGMGDSPDDSVWWVTLSPSTGKVAAKVKLADDLSKWRDGLNKQLKAWDTKSAVKQLSTKRAIRGAIIAGIVCAVAVATVLTAGAFAAAAGTAGAVAGGGGAGAGVGGTLLGGGTVAGGVSKLMPAIKAIGQAAQAGKGIIDQAQAGRDALPPQQQAEVDVDANETAAAVVADVAAGGEVDYTPYYIAAGGVALVAVLAAVAVAYSGSGPRHNPRRRKFRRK